MQNLTSSKYKKCLQQKLHVRVVTIITYITLLFYIKIHDVHILLANLGSHVQINNVKDKHTRIVCEQLGTTWLAHIAKFDVGTHDLPRQFWGPSMVSFPWFLPYNFCLQHHWCQDTKV